MFILDMTYIRFKPRHGELLEELILTKSWRDTIDLIASHALGRYLSLYPEQIHGLTERWITSSSFWLQRSAILFQLRYKQQTNQELLFQLIRRCVGSEEFCIHKAIRWALREYAKSNRIAVEQFVATTELAPLK